MVGIKAEGKREFYLIVLGRKLVFIHEGLTVTSVVLLREFLETGQHATQTMIRDRRETNEVISEIVPVYSHR